MWSSVYSLPASNPFDRSECFDPSLAFFFVLLQSSAILLPRRESMVVGGLTRGLPRNSCCRGVKLRMMRLRGRFQEVWGDVGEVLVSDEVGCSGLVLLHVGGLDSVFYVILRLRTQGYVCLIPCIDWVRRCSASNTNEHRLEVIGNKKKITPQTLANVKPNAHSKKDGIACKASCIFQRILRLLQWSPTCVQNRRPSPPRRQQGETYCPIEGNVIVTALAYLEVLDPRTPLRAMFYHTGHFLA